MSYTKRVLAAIPDKYDIGAEEIQNKTHLDMKSIRIILLMLERSGMIERTKNDRYVKNRKYKSKQKS